jgi:hypothetical protein
MIMTLTSNKNFLSPLGMNFTLQRAPNIRFTCQKANIPGINLGVAPLQTPYTVLPFAGDRITYNELSIDFILNENLDNYFEILEWITGLGFPESRDQYAKLADAGPMSDYTVYSDASILISDSDKNPNLEVKYKNLFPISISDIALDVTLSDVDYLTCTATFQYQSFSISRLNLPT